MRRIEASFATPAIKATATRLGQRLREARLARGWTVRALAERSRVGTATLTRMEAGSVGTSLGAWLAVLEQVGLLEKFGDFDDPVSRALLDATRAKRGRRSDAHDDLDF